MLTSLTPEQEKIMYETREEFISLLDKELDEKEAKEGVKFIYSLAKLKEPMVIIVDSPLACQFVPQFFNVGNQVWNQVRNQVDNQVRNQVGKIEFFSFSWDPLWSSCWVSFYSFFQKVGIFENELFRRYESYIKSGVFMSLYFDGLVVLCRNPTFLSRDEQGRMHSFHDYTIAFKDGYALNYVHGVYFEPELFNHIFKKKEATAKEILELKNTEQKAVAIEYYGYANLLNELNAKVIDTWKTKSKVDGKEVTCELFEFQFERIKARVVKVEDHSVHKITTLGVPISKQTETAKGAVAWTFGLESDKYNPVQES